MKLKSTADGLFAKPVNPYKQYGDAMATEYMEFEANNPELSLTTPMPGNTVFEGVDVWQMKLYGIFTTVRDGRYKECNWNYDAFSQSAVNETRQAYQPLEVKEQVREAYPSNDLAGHIAVTLVEASNPELGVAIRTPNYFLNIRMNDNDVSLSGWEYDTIISAMLDYGNHLKTLKQ